MEFGDFLLTTKKGNRHRKWRKSVVMDAGENNRKGEGERGGGKKEQKKGACEDHREACNSFKGAAGGELKTIINSSSRMSQASPPLSHFTMLENRRRGREKPRRQEKHINAWLRKNLVHSS